MNIDLGHSVTYPFEDKYWTVKLIVFLILGFIPGMNFIVWSGYAISIARNMFRREPLPLPDWSNWSDIAVRGLLGMAATGLYLSPALVIACALAGISFFMGGRGDSLFLALRCLGAGLLLLYVISVNYFLAVGHVRFAQSDQFAAYLDIRGRWRDLRTAPQLFGTLFLYQFMITMILIGLTLIGAALMAFMAGLIVALGGLAGLILVIVAALAVAGFIALVTMGFLANGYILGMAIFNLVEHYEPRKA